MIPAARSLTRNAPRVVLRSGIGRPTFGGEQQLQQQWRATVTTGSRRCGEIRLFGTNSRKQRRSSSSSSSSSVTTDEATESSETTAGKTTTTPTTLEWETFDYSESPKWDARFNDTRAVAASNPDEWDDIYEMETREDLFLSERFDRHARALQSLTPELVARATRVLLPYITKERMVRMEQVLSQRTNHCRFLFENPANPSNVWACLRTIDSFGIQCVDVVIASGKYQGKAALAQKRGMRTAMGSAQWLTLRNHVSTKGAIDQLREEGYKIYASDLNPNSQDIRTVDWDDDGDADRPICIVMGNENDGISEEMRGLVDATFTLPMCGFAESFNLSVATAITLAHLSARSSSGSSSSDTADGRPKGPLRPGDLSQHDFNCLRLRGILHSIAQKKACRAILKREGIELPSELEWVK